MKRKCTALFLMFAICIGAIFMPGTYVSAVTILVNTNYELVNQSSGKLLDVNNCSTADGASVIQWDSNGGVNQQWKFVDAGGGYYKIVNVNSGKLLDVSNCSTADGASIIQWSDNGGANQQWKIVDTGSYCTIVNRQSGKLIDISGASTANGANAIQWSSNNGANQHWTIRAVTSTPITGNVTYTLQKSANPTADQLDAYAKITAAMDKACWYYNRYTTYSRHLTVQYVPSIATADASSNGNIRFGSNKGFMQCATAMHEIAHTTGIGTSTTWSNLTNSRNVYTGVNGTNMLRQVTGDSSAILYGDDMHFWPYGLNYESEVKSEVDLINHCKIVEAIRKDMV